MENPQVRFARLDKQKIERLRQLEEKLGTLVLAFEPVMKIADLTPDQLGLLQQAEKELDVILVAYEPLK